MRPTDVCLLSGEIMAGVFMQVQAISIGLTVEDLALISAFVPFICTIGIVAVGKQNKNGVRAGHF